VQQAPAPILLAVRARDRSARIVRQQPPQPLRIAREMAVIHISDSRAALPTHDSVRAASSAHAHLSDQQQLPHESPRATTGAFDGERGATPPYGYASEHARAGEHKFAEDWIMEGPLPSGAEQMGGWLNKQHQRAPGRWAKRWFAVDDRKGRLSYAHKEGSKKVSVSIPLQELSVFSTDLSERDYSFVISCSPLRLVLSAPSEEERRRWIDNLQLRVKLWKAKVAEEGPRVAQVLELDGVSVSNDSNCSGDTGVESFNVDDATGGR